MRPVLSILIYSNSWVAFCVAALVGGIAHHYQLPHLWLYTFWAFTGTVSAYQLHRLVRLRQLHHTVRSNRRLLWMQNSYPFQLAWLAVNLCAFGVMTLLVPFNVPNVALLLINAMIVGLYVLPLPFLKNGVRNLPFAKNLLISASWTCMCVFPFLEIPQHIPWEVIPLVFITVFAQIVPFDIRDVSYDPQSMKTLPQLIGEQAARYTGFVLLLAMLGLQYTLLGFHWLLPFTIFCGAVGHLIPFKVGYQLRLEFMWELPLGLMGLWFWLG